MLYVRPLITLALLALSTTALANTGDQEIRYLIDSIGDSNCTFTRNGTEHTAEEARSHLAMKYDRVGSRRVSTAETFIDKLASESSWTGKPYMMECDGASIPSREWLTTKLTQHRTNFDSSSGGEE